MVLVDGAPFDILPSMDGSNDFVAVYPCVGISAYTESISVVAFFLHFPLQPMR